MMIFLSFLFVVLETGFQVVTPMRVCRLEQPLVFKFMDFLEQCFFFFGALLPESDLLAEFAGQVTDYIF